MFYLNLKRALSFTSKHLNRFTVSRLKSHAFSGKWRIADEQTVISSEDQDIAIIIRLS